MSDAGEPEGDQVLIATAHDVRYFITMLRGVNISNRATFAVTGNGLIVSVEEARTLLATAYIYKSVFDEFIYNPDTPQSQSQPQPESQEDEEEEKTSITSFEIQLTTLIDCLNIFGTAGTSASATTKYRRWKTDQPSDNEEDRNEQSSRSKKSAANGRIEQFFGSEKGTGMHLTYAGAGYPLTLLVAEDSKGPTATCEITTFQPDPVLTLDFEPEDAVAQLILKSSWLRDALSEIDPSYDKLTIICNPPPEEGRAAGRSSPPRLRLHAAGNFGSTEMDYPSDREVLESCKCNEQVKYSYRLKHILHTQRALQSSTKTSLRISHTGLLSLQLMMPTPHIRDDQSNDLIEFRVSVFVLVTSKHADEHVVSAA